MLPPRQEAIGCFEALIQHYSREIPSDVSWSSPRCTELSSSTAGIKHSPLPRAMLSSDFPWGTLLSSVELHGHLCAEPSLLLEGSRHFHVYFAGCPNSPGLQPLAPSTCTQRYLFLSASLRWGLTASFWSFLYQLPSQFIFGTESHLCALPMTLLSCVSFLPCPHAHSSMLNYLPLLPLGVTRALTQWDCLCA